jgi:hypothetical protein
VTFLLLPVLVTLGAAAPGVEPGVTPPVTVRSARASTRAQTGGELLAAATADLTRLRRALAEVLDRVEDARRERDLLKLLCLDERVSQIKVLLAVAERAETALTEAVVNRDEGADVELSKIAIAKGKIDALRTEAAACIGQLAYEVNERTEVFVEEPEELPEEKTSAPVTRPEPGTDPYRSPFGIPSAP